MKKIEMNSFRLFYLTSTILFNLIVFPSLAQNNIEQIIVKDKDVQRAVDLYNKADFPNAKSILDGIIDKNNKNADAHYALAIVLNKLKKLDDAIDENKKAIELNGSNADYHYALARLYMVEIGTANIFSKMSLSSSIKEELIAALKIDPNHRLAMINLANFYFQAPSIAGGDNDKALELANKLLKIDEKQARILLVQIYSAMNNNVKATEEINNLIKIDEYTGRYLLIIGFKKQGDLVKAEEQYKIIESKFGNNPEYFAFFNDYGYFLLGQKRVDEAIEKFKKQVQLAPKSANAHDSLGEGYYNKKMLKESLAEYTTALQLNPDMKSAKDKIKEIKGLMEN